MKETFLKTGSLQEVDIVVQRMSNQSVKDQDTEKPVTKLMLKEIYKWDECCPQNFDMHACRFQRFLRHVTPCMSCI